MIAADNEMRQEAQHETAVQVKVSKPETDLMAGYTVTGCADQICAYYSALPSSKQDLSTDLQLSVIVFTRHLSRGAQEL